MTRDDDDRKDDLEPAQESERISECEQDGDFAADDGVRLRLPAGFAQSLMPNIDVAVANMLAPIREQMKAMLPDTSAYARDIMGPLNRRLQEQMKSALPDYDALVKNALEPYNERVNSQVASIVASLPTFTGPMIDFPTLKGVGVGPAIEPMLKQIASRQSAMLDGLRGSLKPLFDPEMLRGFNRALLPPNLRSHAGEVQAHQVHEFLEQEGIPLYLVPRGRTALRLLRAQDRPGRRRVLGDCYESITDDCAIVLEQANRDVVGDELNSYSTGSARCVLDTSAQPRRCSLSRSTRSSIASTPTRPLDALSRIARRARMCRASSRRWASMRRWSGCRSGTPTSNSGSARVTKCRTTTRAMRVCTVFPRVSLVSVTAFRFSCWSRVSSATQIGSLWNTTSWRLVPKRAWQRGRV